MFDDSERLQRWLASRVGELPETPELLIAQQLMLAKDLALAKSQPDFGPNLAAWLEKEKHVSLNEEQRTYTTGSGQVLERVHIRNDECDKYGCVIHNPSAHAESIGPTHWTGVGGGIMRTCTHGILHHDPDGQNWLERVFGKRKLCSCACRCCDPPTSLRPRPGESPEATVNRVINAVKGEKP